MKRKAYAKNMTKSKSPKSNPPNEIRIAFYGGIADYHLSVYSFHDLLGKRKIVVDYESPELLIFDANHPFHQNYKRHPKVPSVMFSGENITLFRNFLYLYPAWYGTLYSGLRMLLPKIMTHSRWYGRVDRWLIRRIRWIYVHSAPCRLAEFMRGLDALLRRRIGVRYDAFLTFFPAIGNRRVDYVLRCRKGQPGHVVTSNVLPRGVKGVSFPYCLPVIKLFEEQKGLVLDKPLPSNPHRPYFATMVVSNFYSIDRMSMYYRLSRYRKVHLSGRYKQHRLPKIMYQMAEQDQTFIPPLPSGWTELVPYYSQYKFVLCFENSFAENYITEKLLMALLSGAIPIYRGAPNVGDYFNTDRFIHYQGSYQQMLRRVRALDQDAAAYAAVCAHPIWTEKHKQLHAHKWHQISDYFRIMLETLNG